MRLGNEDGRELEFSDKGCSTCHTHLDTHPRSRQEACEAEGQRGREEQAPLSCTVRTTGMHVVPTLGARRSH